MSGVRVLPDEEGVLISGLDNVPPTVGSDLWSSSTMWRSRYSILSSAHSTN